MYPTLQIGSLQVQAFTPNQTPAMRGPVHLRLNLGGAEVVLDQQDFLRLLGYAVVTDAVQRGNAEPVLYDPDPDGFAV